MGEQFEVRREQVVSATPEQVWDAVTVNLGGWLWPVSYEPRVGGRETGLAGGEVTAWEPRRRVTTHATGPDGWFNTLDNVLTPVDGGTHLTYTHQGVHEKDWDLSQAQCVAHTDFYVHTLAQYVEHFPGRPATYVSAHAPEGVTFAGVLAALGLSDAAVGSPVRVTAPDGTVVEGVVDYRAESFLGVRTADSLFRVFGRDHWGGRVAIAHHVFGGESAPARAWTKWLASLA